MVKEQWMPIVNCGLNAGDAPLCWDGKYFDSEEKCQEWIEENGDNFTMNEMAGCVCPMFAKEIDCERVAIIDHNTHKLFIEDIPMDILNEKYKGEEEAYIKDNYEDMTNFSWDYITEANYIPPTDDPDPITIEFEDLIEE